MKRRAVLLVLLSFVGLVSELSATVTARHYDFEEGTAGGEATELVDITDEQLHENADDFFGWGGHIWIEVSGQKQARCLMETLMMPWRMRHLLPHR